MSDMNQLVDKEMLEEQTKDAINILQLLEVELAANEDDSHIIRTVAIVEKMLQKHLKSLQQLEFNSDSENTRRSISEP